MYVPLGSILTYQAKGLTTNDGAQSAADAETQIAAYISASSIDVIDYNIVQPSLANAVVGEFGSAFTYDFQMTLTLKTRVTDYADENDVKSIVDSAVQAILNKPPTSVITKVQVPSGATTTTAPNQTAPNLGSVGTTSTSASRDSSTTSFWDTFSTFLKGAGVGGFLGIGLALVGVVLLVSLATSKKIIPGA
jgi:hypothetical protein